MTEEPPALGRPRDPLLERRALEATIVVYARHGWSGFTFGKVAAEARVGKSSLYLRWPTKTDLLAAAFDEFDAFFFHGYGALEDLPFAERMRRLIRHRLALYFTPAGLAVIRLFVEYRSDPDEMGQIFDRSVGMAVRRTRKLLETAIDRGDLVRETSVVHLGDAIEGALIIHALSTPNPLRERAIENLDTYTTQLAERTLGPWLTDKAVLECGYCTVGVAAGVPAARRRGLAEHPT